MKKLSYLFMIVLGAYAFQGCNSAPKDEKANADSLNKAKDTSSNAQVTGGIAATNDDAKFATNAAEGGMVEVALGNLAQQKSVNLKIKNFGAMMVTDHGKAGATLSAIAKTKNITLPTAITADDQKNIDDLAKNSVKDFDKAYVDAMIDGHTKALKLFQDAAKNCSDADLKSFASKTVPVVQAHLDAIKEIKAGLK
jgi:putative membrane protein